MRERGAWRTCEDMGGRKGHSQVTRKSLEARERAPSAKCSPLKPEDVLGFSRTTEKNGVRWCAPVLPSHRSLGRLLASQPHPTDEIWVKGHVSKHKVKRDWRKHSKSTPGLYTHVAILKNTQTHKCLITLWIPRLHYLLGGKKQHVSGCAVVQP